jgi:hypothetical protein
MRSGALRMLTLAVLVLVATATVASAQVPIRIRGTIAKVSGQTLTIASRDKQPRCPSRTEPSAPRRC